MMESNCPFCALPPDRVVDREGPVLAFRDAFPVAPGHTLVIPARHVPSFRDLAPDEASAAFRLLQRQAAALSAADPAITGFNVGANDGPDAGQTVFHCHIHLIPRRHGDHPHPRGGVRAVIPGRADYPSPS
jgi:diadenosine tetraphosphate (Ap4A) HIT family hydrolase